jgi:hypothetical protein
MAKRIKIANNGVAALSEKGCSEKLRAKQLRQEKTGLIR